MAEWDEYVSNLLKLDIDFDQLTVSLDNGETYEPIPPIIKASVEMIDKMTEKQGNLNAFVFPERAKLYFIFLLVYVFHNISRGVLEGNYDPNNFIPGEKYKIGNAIVEYLGEEKADGKERIKIRLADLDLLSVPLENAPFFQKVSTNRKLSKVKQYRIALKETIFSDPSNENLARVMDLKTHLGSSVFCVTTLNRIRDQFSKCRINNKKISDIFFIGQVDYEGNISNIGSGQLSGVPAIVCASDLYSVLAAVEKKNPVYAIIIDGANSDTFENQLDALDALIKKNIHIIYISDTVNSFDLEFISTRGFNIWRWNKSSLSKQLFSNPTSVLSKQLKNCADHSVEYFKVDDDGLSEAYIKISNHRKETEQQSSQIMSLFEQLNNLFFKAFRSITPFRETEIESAQKTLDNCCQILQQEKSYMNETTALDYEFSLTFLRKLYSRDFSLKKIEQLENYLLVGNKKDLCIVIPANADKTYIADYWTRWCTSHYIATDIKIMFPLEYAGENNNEIETTLICGWLNRANMRKIIYSYNSPYYIVLMYKCEQSWKNSAYHHWESDLNNSSNKAIIKKVFSTEKIPVQIKNDEEEIQETPKTEENTEELDDIEYTIKNNKYRRYTHNESYDAHELVEALPIGFAGGALAFYQAGHRLISATKLIQGEAEQIENILPDELNVGDFIVVRESDRDLIRDIADLMLKNSGKQELREMAEKWRDAIKLDLTFCSEEEFFIKLQKAGCRRNVDTIRDWIENEDIIAPQSKEDLELIAKVTENETLKELLDEVYNAAKEVRAAHTSAGRKLSEQLKRTIGNELMKYKNMDPLNIWQPIDMLIEGVGKVIILKVDDIGEKVEIDRMHTNRLIEE